MSGGQSSFDDSSATTPGNLRRGVSECRRSWQRTKKERLFLQHTNSPGETSRRFYARVSTKFQDKTIVSLGGKAAYGPNRSQELADEMADGWERIMTHAFASPEETSAFMARASPPDRVDDSNVTSDIDQEDVSAALSGSNAVKPRVRMSSTILFTEITRMCSRLCLPHCTPDG